MKEKQKKNSSRLPESTIQAKTIEKWEKMGWYAVKLIQTNKNGIPDILFLKDGKCIFAECKVEGGRLRPLQEHRKKELEAFGFEVLLIDKL